MSEIKYCIHGITTFEYCPMCGTARIMEDPKDLIISSLQSEVERLKKEKDKLKEQRNFYFEESCKFQERKYPLHLHLYRRAKEMDYSQYCE